VECKLWRNPEARRTVVAQVLDYAKEIARWSYQDLESAVKRAARDGKSIVDGLRLHQPDIDEAALHDEVQSGLSNGQFNLLIVGDGIREGTRQLVEYLTQDVALGYRFGLIELAVYRMPEGAPPGFILQPRILAQTIEIPRVIIRGSEVARSIGADAQACAPTAARRLQEDEIRAALAEADPGLLPLFDGFITSIAPLGVQLSVQRSFTLHWPVAELGNVNFGSIFPDGTIATTYICDSAKRAGDKSIGEQYLSELSALLPGSEVRRKGEEWTWKVVVDGRAPKVRPLLEKAQEWRALIARTQDRFRELMPVAG
jgi:hypothetical protein